ncbi:MAG: hypothetical protein JJE09_04525, partial [Bacteroidia bacterium]|nr:hypothetical protein [Bacteroidia bacterium]
MSNSFTPQAERLYSSRINKLIVLTAVIVFSAGSFRGLAQSATPALNFYAKKQKGFGFVTSDSVFSLNFQFRMQNRAMY